MLVAISSHYNARFCAHRKAKQNDTNQALKRPMMRILRVAFSSCCDLGVAKGVSGKEEKPRPAAMPAQHCTPSSCRP